MSTRAVARRTIDCSPDDQRHRPWPKTLAARDGWRCSCPALAALLAFALLASCQPADDTVSGPAAGAEQGASASPGGPPAAAPAASPAASAEPSAAAAATVDPALLEPFLGTWSGVFTTQDDEFWGIEDFVCFGGCPPAARAHLAALLDDPANDERSVDDLLGESFGIMARDIAGILTPEGRLAQQENTSENDAKLHCQPYGYVREVTNPLPMTVSLDDGHLLFRYEEWSLLRTVYMDGRAHPEHRTPTMLGHPVGRIENGALVIETARVTPGRISDFTNAGYSGALTGIERYTVHDDPRRLELELTIEDPVMLTEPYRVIKTWLATPDVELVQDRCSELPGKL